MGNQPDYSLEVAHEIDEEVRKLIEAAHTEAWEILNTYRDILDDLVFELLQKETLTRESTWSGSSTGSRSGRGSPRSTTSAGARRRTSRRSRPPPSWPASAASRGRPTTEPAREPTPVGSYPGGGNGVPSRGRTAAARPSRPAATPVAPASRPAPAGYAGAAPSDQPRSGSPTACPTAARVRSRRTRCCRTTARRRTGGPRPRPPGSRGRPRAGSRRRPPRAAVAGNGRTPDAAGHGHRHVRTSAGRRVGRRRVRRTWTRPDHGRRRAGAPGSQASLGDGRAVPELDRPRAEAAIRELLIAVGEDPDREGLRETPARVARAYAEIFAGPLHRPRLRAGQDVRREPPRADPGAGHPDVLDCCEHHLVPFHGVAHVGYIPGSGGRVTGLSKLARLVDLYARRPQVQERLTGQVADAMVRKLEPRGRDRRDRGRAPVHGDARHPQAGRAHHHVGRARDLPELAQLARRGAVADPGRGDGCRSSARPGVRGVGRPQRHARLVLRRRPVPRPRRRRRRTASRCAAAGADLVDVGGESTRPGRRADRRADGDRAGCCR